MITSRKDYLLGQRKRQKAGRREYIERRRFGGEEAPAGYWDEPRFNAPGPPETVTPETTYQAPTRAKLFEQQWAGQESQRRSRLEALDRLKVQQGAKGLKTGRTPEQLGEIGLARRETLPGLFPEATTREAEVGKFEQMLPLEQQVARQETRQKPALTRLQALTEAYQAAAEGTPEKMQLGQELTGATKEVEGGVGTTPETGRNVLGEAIERTQQIEAESTYADTALADFGLDEYLGNLIKQDDGTIRRVGGTLSEFVGQARTGLIESKALDKLEDFIDKVSQLMADPKTPEPVKDMIKRIIFNNDDYHLFTRGREGWDRALKDWQPSRSAKAVALNELAEQLILLVEGTATEPEQQGLLDKTLTPAFGEQTLGPG